MEATVEFEIVTGASLVTSKAPPPSTMPMFPPGPPEPSMTLPLIVVPTMLEEACDAWTAKIPPPSVIPPFCEALEGPWPPRASPRLPLIVEFAMRRVPTTKTPMPSAMPPCFSLPPTTDPVLLLTLVSTRVSLPVMKKIPTPSAMPPGLPGAPLRLAVLFVTTELRRVRSALIERIPTPSAGPVEMLPSRIVTPLTSTSAGPRISTTRKAPPARMTVSAAAWPAIVTLFSLIESGPLVRV